MTKILNIDNIPLSREYKGMGRRCNAPLSVIVFFILGVICSLSFGIFPSQALPADTAVAAFEQHVKSLYETIELKKSGLDLACFRYALLGYFNLKSKGVIKRDDIISIVDFRQSCNGRRF